MPRVSRLVDLDPEALAAWYVEQQVPLAFRSLHPLVLAYIVRASGGDWRRCVVDDDGSVVVYNHPVWEPGQITIQPTRRSR